MKSSPLKKYTTPQKASISSSSSSSSKEISRSYKDQNDWVLDTYSTVSKRQIFLLVVLLSTAIALLFYESDLRLLYLGPMAPKLWRLKQGQIGGKSLVGDLHLPSRDGLVRPRYTATIISPADEMILANDMMQVQIRSNSASRSLAAGNCITVGLKLDQLDLEIKGRGGTICELDSSGLTTVSTQISSLVSASDGYAYGAVLNGPHELVITLSYGGIEQHKTSSAFYLFQEAAQSTADNNDIDANNGFYEKSALDTETVQEQEQHVSSTSSSSRGSVESLAIPSDNVILLKKGLEIVYPTPESKVAQELLQMRIAVPYILLQFEGLKLELVFDDARFDLTAVMWGKIELDPVMMSQAASSALDRLRAVGSGCDSSGGGSIGVRAATAVDMAGDAAAANTSATTFHCIEAAHSVSRWWSAYSERAIFSFDVGGLDVGAHSVQIVASTSSYMLREASLPAGGSSDGASAGWDEQRVEASPETEDQTNKKTLKVLEFDAIRVFRTK